MFKLVGVGGAVRGKNFEISDGAFIVGRSDSAQIKLNYEGISKSHFKITNTNGSLILEDMGSANGTFINEKLVKTQYLKTGDLISVPGAIFKLIKYRSPKGHDVNQDIFSTKIGNDLNSKNFEDTVKDNNNSILVKLLKKFVLKIIYDFNNKYQWSSILVVLVALFTLSNIFFTIGPCFRRCL